MKNFNVSMNWLWSSLFTSLILVNILVLLVPGFDPLKAVFGAVWLCIIPGLLIAHIIRFKTTSLTETLAYAVGFSVLLTMITALVSNTLLPLAGNLQPLDRPTLMGSFDIIWLALIAVTIRRTPETSFTVSFKNVPKSTILGAITGFILIGLSIFGALTLNNGGSGLVTWFMLILAIGYLSVIFAHRDKISENVIGFSIFSTALALLLMTSLRGWFTTGHDVQREYLVFLNTLHQLRWSIGSLSDAYNACLSITILPTVINQITGISETYVYKTVFQVIFALMPVVVYLIARKLSDRHIGLLAAVYFMAFPTFFSDMTMLNRQEIAFIFLGLAFLTLFNDTWSILRRRSILAVLGVGVIVSHYSTNYTMIFMFGMLVSLRFGLQIFRQLSRLIKHRSRSKKRVITQHATTSPVSILLIAGLLTGSFIWSSQLTHTSDNIPRIFNETLQSISNGFKSDSKSSDTSYSIVGASSLTDQQRLEAYLKTAVPKTRHEFGEDEFFANIPTSTYTPVATKSQNSPLTSLGKSINHLGIPVATLNSLIRQGSAMFLQLMVLLGIGVLFFANPLRLRFTDDFRLLQLSSIALLAGIVALPVLSAEYGLLRAFQQMLILSGTTIAVTTIWIIPKRFKRLRFYAPATIALLFLASSTGVITTLLGGYPAQLHLANSGKYYDLYYPHKAEQAAITWLSDTMSTAHGLQTIQTNLQYDRYNSTAPTDPQFVSISNNIYPNVIRQDSYVLISGTVLSKHEATVYYNGDLISYLYPLQFLDENKDLLYSSNGARIYQ